MGIRVRGTGGLDLFHSRNLASIRGCLGNVCNADYLQRNSKLLDTT
jgi:hypothetical protein